MRYRFAVFTLLVILALSACNLSSSGVPAAAPTPTGSSSGTPVVTILSPQNGAEVLVNQQILVSANANDPVGITRVQLFANGQIAKTVSSETPGGDPNLNVLLDYTPTTTGALTLQVIAYRGAIASAPAEIALTVRQNQAQVTATQAPPPIIVPPINPNDPTCRVLVNAPLNFRTGPGVVYDRISVLASGTVAPITGRTGDNSWYQIRVGITTGWVSGGYVTLYGNCQSIGIPPIPPTPTPRITATFMPTNTLTLTAQPPTATPTAGLPDLIVTNLSLVEPSLQLEPGDTPTSGTFSVTITNTGLSVTGQFDNTITVTAPSSTSTETSLGVVSSLAPGESIVLNISLTFTESGSHTIQVRADSASQVTEASEVNNTAITTVTVAANP
ncbi:MAG: SH3 domain-containing protein [Anaerolineae bacterium]|nr:SH3 domain-containing protein [Anaerolineae bacterium]